MKLERRGKYPGVKVHLEPEECSAMVDGETTPHLKLRKLIRKAMIEDPSLFSERSEDEIQEELKEERDKALLKLSNIKKGKKWNSK